MRMMRRTIALLLLATSASAGACPVVSASFEHADARAALIALAEDAGYRIVNPEVITGHVDAELESMDAQKAFFGLAGAMGYAPRVEGYDVTAHVRRG
jgi:hypothetical protein